jgi:signal transduction histidine kinase
VRAAHLERLGQQRSRIRVVVDDQELEIRTRKRSHVDRPAFRNRSVAEVNARKPLQDSGPPDSRLLARLLQAGILVLGERDELRFASTAACDAFGVASEAELRAAWDDIAAQLAVADWPRDLQDGVAYHGRADVRMSAGVRCVRFETHALGHPGSAQRVVLVRDRGHLSPGDRTMLLASEAQANRHVLTGLVHAAKGPLNNFNLTLALLAAGLARAEALSIGPEMLARWTRYVDVLRNEAVRLAGSVDEIHALTLLHEPAPEAIDLCATLRGCAHVLRHDAAIREIDLELDAPESALYAMGDPQLVPLALLAFTICLLDATPSGGRVAWRLTDSEHMRALTIAITTSHLPLPAGLVDSLFRLSCVTDSAHSAAIAGRLIIEAQGGDVLVDNGDTGTPGFRIRIPARA